MSGPWDWGVRWRGMGRTGALVLVGLAGTTGCPGVTKLDAQSSQEGLPPAVDLALERSCRAPGMGCHADGIGGVSFESTGGFVGSPIAQPGNLDGSRMIIRIRDGSMPPPGRGVELTEDDRYILFGWIADGAPLVEVDSGGVAGTDTGDASESSSESSGPSDESSGESSGDTDVPEPDAFVPVLEIMEANCGGVGCHRDGGATSPPLDDDVAYDNLIMGVGEASPVVVPNDPEGSRLVTRIVAQEMPPDYSEFPPLSDDDIGTIVEWIENGAEP